MTDRAQLRALSRAAWPKADQPPPADPFLLAKANRALCVQLDQTRRMLVVLLLAMSSTTQSRRVQRVLDELRDLHNITTEDLTNDR